MGLIKYLLLFLILVNKVFAFEVIAIKTIKIEEEKPVKIEVKLPVNSEFKGKLRGLATAVAEGGGSYYVNIQWSDFINQKNNTVKQLDNNQFKSSFVLKTQFIKMNQSIDVSGNLSSAIEEENKDIKNEGQKEEQKSSNTSNGMSNPNANNLGTEQSNKNDNKNEAIVIPKPQRSSLNCNPVINEQLGIANIYYEEFYEKPTGDIVVTKPCSSSKESVKLQHESCDIFHDYPQNISLRKRSTFIETKEGKRELDGCMPYESTISHKFDESKCAIKNLNGVAIIEAKRYIEIPETNQKIYLTDCEPIGNQNISVDLRGCSPSMYLVQKEGFVVYPAGKRYVDKDNNRIYLDANCMVLLDYGKPWLTFYTHWEHWNGDNGKNNGWSKEWWKYSYDFSNLEGGFAKDIESYVKNEVGHVFVSERKERIGKCGNWLNPSKHKNVFYTFRRGGDSQYEKFMKDICERD